MPEGTYLTDRLTDDAVKYVEGADVAKPFLLTVFYYAVHDPHHGRPDLVEKYKAEHPGRKAWQYEFGSMVGAVDESVGRIRAALKGRGMASNTAIFFVGDQGGKLRNYPLTGTKKGGQSLYEGRPRRAEPLRRPGVRRLAGRGLALPPRLACAREGHSLARPRHGGVDEGLPRAAEGASRTAVRPSAPDLQVTRRAIPRRHEPRSGLHNRGGSLSMPHASGRTICRLTPRARATPHGEDEGLGRERLD